MQSSIFLLDTYKCHDLCIHAVAIDDKVIESWIEDETNVIVTGGFQPTSKPLYLYK